MKKSCTTILFLCFYLFSVCSLHAQETKTDSLVREFKAVTDPAQKAELAVKIAILNQVNNQTLADDYVKKSLFYAEKAGNNNLAGNARSVQGTIYYINGNFDQARSYYQKSVELFQKSKNRQSVATGINNIGLTYINQGRYSEGLKYQFESLAIYDSIGFEQGVSRSYNAIAVVYTELGNITKDTSNYQNALIYLRKCLLTSKKINDMIGYNNNLINIGNIYRSTAVLDSAIFYYRQAETLAKSRSDEVAYSNALGNIADVFFQKRNYDETIVIGEQALKLKKEIGDQLGQASIFLILSDAYHKTGDDKKSFDYLIEAYALAQKAGAVKEQSLAARRLAQQQADKGNYSEAWDLLNTYANLQDSIASVENKQIVQELQRFTDEDQKKQIELLTQKSQIAELKSNRQSQWLLFSVIGFALLLITAIMIYSRFLVKKRANNDLQLAYSTIEEKNKSITDSIRYAKNLQEAILPSSEYIQRLLPQHFIFYNPKDIVAGDFYWVEEYKKQVYFAAADCTGHGVPGALVSVICSKALREAIFQYGLTDPGPVLDKATDIVLETFDRSGNEVNDGMDISLACWNPETRELKWAGAYNPLILFSGEQMFLLKPDKQPVGRTEIRKPFTTHSLQLKETAMAYLFTDGYADQFGGEKGKKFKQKQLLGFLESIAGKDCPEQLKLLETMFSNWKGKLEQVDDVLVLGVKL